MAAAVLRASCAEVATIRVLMAMAYLRFSSADMSFVVGLLATDDVAGDEGERLTGGRVPAATRLH